MSPPCTNCPTLKQPIQCQYYAQNWQTFKENVFKQAYQQLTGLAWITNTSVLGFSPTDVKLKLTEVRHDWPVNAISFLPAYETNSHLSLASNNTEPSNQTDDISFYVAWEVWCTISLSYDGSICTIHTPTVQDLKILALWWQAQQKG